MPEHFVELRLGSAFKQFFDWIPYQLSKVIKWQFCEIKLSICFLSTWEGTYSQPKARRKVSIKVQENSARWSLPSSLCLIKLTPSLRVTTVVKTISSHFLFPRSMAILSSLSPSWTSWTIWMRSRSGSSTARLDRSSAISQALSRSVIGCLSVAYAGDFLWVTS